MLHSFLAFDSFRDRVGRTALLVLALASPVAAQTFELLPFKDVDPAWRSETDPTLNCDLLPMSGPDSRAIGLTAALAAAERRELTVGGLGYALTWADREGNPAHIPVLKRIVEGYRCFYDHAELAVTAIESAGEPRDYFLALAANGSRDDHLAASGMNALAIRGDSAAYAPLRSIALSAPQLGKFGVDLAGRFNIYLGGMRNWAEFETWPVRRQIDFGARSVLDAVRGPVVRTVRGDSVSQQENFNGGSIYAIPRRALRRMARTYPSAVEAALVAYADTARSNLLRRGVTPAQVPLYLTLVERQGRETAFPSNGPPLPPAVTSAAIRPSVCIEASPAGSVPGRYTAVFSYKSAEPSAVRVAYGDLNSFLTSSGPGVSPEVFFPDTMPDAPGRQFRVVFSTSDYAFWKLLGRYAFARPDGPRCGGPPVCFGDPATIYVSKEGRVVGGPLDGQVYAGVLTGTPGSDVIVGTEAADRIDSGDSGEEGDVVCALGGDDEIRGGAGEDGLVGGAGNDIIDGGAGDDYLLASDYDDTDSPGADLLLGGPGDDYLEGGAGDDSLDGGDGAEDYADGSGGFDLCTAEEEDSCEGDYVPPFAGPTCAERAATVYVSPAGRVVGGPLDGRLFAGRLLGTPGPDVIVGTPAADALDGDAGDDTLCGLDGDDALVAGLGTDTADGGPGTDGCETAETQAACEGAVPALTDVRPVLECVAPAPGGGFTAYFGAENRGTRAGRVAYGANNRITPAAFDGQQPDLFGLPAVVAGRPGRTPFFPGHAFTVTFQPGQTVVWKLFTRTSTASASSARCPAP